MPCSLRQLHTHHNYNNICYHHNARVQRKPRSGRMQRYRRECLHRSGQNWSFCKKSVSCSLLVVYHVYNYDDERNVNHDNSELNNHVGNVDNYGHGDVHYYFADLYISHYNHVCDRHQHNDISNINVSHKHHHHDCNDLQHYVNYHDYHEQD